MVDATPNCSCLEQETFIFRYLKRINDTYSIEERFYTFLQNTGKTGEEIAKIIFNFLEKLNVPLEDCRGQGYDNAAMSGAVHTNEFNLDYYKKIHSFFIPLVHVII